MVKNETPTLKAFGILEHLATSDRALTLTEIATDLDSPKASIHRMLSSLEEGGLIIRDAGLKHAYTIGPRLSRLSTSVLNNVGVQRVRHAILKSLVADIQQTCNLTMLVKSDVLYLDRMEAPSPLRLDLQPGTTVPAHGCASGKLFLAKLPLEKRQRLLANSPLNALTPNTVTNLAQLELELERIALRNVSIDNEEFVLGITCIAVPILDDNGHCIAAIAMHGQVAVTPLETSLSFVPRLQEAARELAKTFMPNY